MKKHTYIVGFVAFAMVLSLGYTALGQEIEMAEASMDEILDVMALEEAAVAEDIEITPLELDEPIAEAVGSAVKTDEPAVAVPEPAFEEPDHVEDKVAESLEPIPSMPEPVPSKPEPTPPKKPEPTPKKDDVMAARKAESLKAAIDSKDKAWAQRDEALKARDEALAQRDEAQKARDDAALASGERISELEELLSEKQEEILKLQRSLTIKDGEITDLQMALSKVQSATRQEKFTLAYNLGCIYKAGRQFNKAEIEFQKALRHAPDDPAVHYNLGILYDDNLGNAKKARHHYERFLELAPTDSDAPNVVEWLSELQ